MKLNKDDEVIYERIFTEKDVYDENGDHSLHGILRGILLD